MKKSNANETLVSDRCLPRYSAAPYTWMGWRAYKLETKANEVCKDYVEKTAGEFLKGALAVSLAT
jgi:hypothetical protein